METALTLELVKSYMRVDYEDDDEIIEIMLEAVYAEMSDLIPSFNRDAPTARQKILILASVKELYEDRSKRTEKPERLRAAVSSMLLKEMLNG